MSKVTHAYFDAISPDAPCGESLDYEIDDLIRQAQGAPAREMGDSIIPAEEPNWKKIQDVAFKLLARGRNIRITVLLTQILVHTKGFEGIDEGVSLTNGLLQQYWDQVHPQQDEGEFVARINALRDMNDFGILLNTVRNVPLTQSRMGLFSLRDIELAEGKIQPPSKETEVVKMSQISAAFQDSDVDVLRQKSESITHALEQVKGISDITAEKLGVAQSVDLSELIKSLQSLLKIMDPYIQITTEQVTDEKYVPDEGDGFFVSDSAVVGSEKVMSVIKGVSGRDDVLKSLEAICAYFDRYEPSSPVPLLLRRAGRMVNMDFKELINELAPDGLSQAENVYGKEDKSC